MPDPQAVVFLLDAGPERVQLQGSGQEVPTWSRYAYVHLEPGDSPEPYGWQPRPSIEVVVEVREGRPVVTEFTVKRPGEDTITAATFRSINYKQVIDTVLGGMAMLQGQLTGFLPNPMSDEEAAAAEQSVTRSFHRRRITPELLRQVAQIVAANPDRPTLAVQEQMYTGYRNATRYIAEARRAGFLQTDAKGGDQ